MNRREFLKYLSGAGLALGASSWLTEQLWALHQQGKLPKPANAPLEEWLHTLCHLCPGGCGLRIRRYEGLPVHLAGDPASPINEGGLCPLGAAGLLLLYHPDRIREPLIRTGERGDNRWKAIAWNEALRILQERLQNLRQRGEAHRLVSLEADASTTLRAVVRQFMRAYGSPNVLHEEGPDPGHLAFQLAQGGEGRPAYDLPRARFILSFGFDLLEAEGAPVWQNRCYGQLRTSRHDERGTFVQVEPHLSLTGTQADQWIPLRPGTEAAFALGVAHVLIDEALYDRAFVEQHTFGFEDWVDDQGRSHLGLRTLVLREYAPETVSQLTGVSVEDLMRVARSFGRHDASLALAGRSASAHTNGLYTQLAVQALNALKGNLRKEGGLFRAPEAPLTPLASFEPDEVAQAGLAQPPLDGSTQWPLLHDQMGRFLEHLEAGTPDLPDTLLVFQANPLFNLPDARRWVKAFQRIPFLVSFTSFMDETASQADLILPIPTYLESWGDVADVPGLSWGYAAVSPPIVEPLYDVRHPGDVLIQLAHALGDGTARAFPERNFLEVLKRRYRGVFADDHWHLVSTRDGAAPPETFEAFWSQLTEGGWVSSLSASEAPLHFETPSGKYEFYVQRLADHPAIETSTDKAFLPHLESPQFAGDATKYPYHLMLFDRNTLFGGKGAVLPLMMEMAGFREDISWDSWVEVHPATARQLGINDGDRVWVESEQGRVRTRVRIWPGVPPDVVAMLRGLGHEAYGRYARGRGVNPHQLVARIQDPLTGAFASLATRVRLVNA